MFCFQCQETAKGTGCTISGVCGKRPETSRWQDLLLSVVRGIGTIGDSLNKSNVAFDKVKTGDYLVDALFATITNANFDDAAILAKVDAGIVLKKELLAIAHENSVTLPDYQEVRWGGEKTDYTAEGSREGVLRNDNADLRSLKELDVLGLKGMAAYYEHAARLGERSTDIIDFMMKALATITNPDADMQTLLNNVLETGKYGVDVMALLDKANTGAYGNPEITKVNIGVGKNPGILVSGHDLHDLEDLLEQAQGTGVDVYTHGEMLPAHYYPLFKKYKNLVGNYGNAWWKQKEEFSHFNGPIVFTTNCIVPPSPKAILTSGCAKYKYNKLQLGDINGIPRVLDAGQCNDSYSWAVVALKLKEIFGAQDINDLPIAFNIAWYEQKAVIVLLALLSLGIKNIHIGPTLPAFVSEGVLKVLVDNFGLGTISTVDEDLKTMMA